MKGSLHIATVSGIPVKIHWTFGLLLLYVTFDGIRSEFHPIALVLNIALVLSLFFCVILHEFGHALTAKRFGVNTYDIIMTPIGGIARLERMPEGRGQEFWVAIAGPMVNFIIVIFISLGFLLLTGDALPLFSPSFWNINSPDQNYFLILLKANGYLGLFNLIPAFPMDGGRILRSLLSLRMDRGRATQLAAYAGQVIAIVMFGYGLYTRQPIMTLIGVFIFFAARQENRMLQRQSMMTRLKGIDVMEPVQHVIFNGQSLSDAREKIRGLDGDSFIVWSRVGIPSGYITRDQIEKYNPLHQSDILIDAFVIPAPAVVAEDTDLAGIFAFMQQHKLPIILVSDHQHYRGIIHWRKIADLIRG